MKIFYSLVLITLFCTSGFMVGKQFQRNEINYAQSKNEQFSSKFLKNKNKIEKIGIEIQNSYIKLEQEDNALKNIKILGDQKIEKEINEHPYDASENSNQSLKGPDDIFTEMVEYMFRFIALFG